jgi:hypothetical protein
MIGFKLIGESGMDSVVDLAESRKAKTEKSEQFRDAARDLLLLLEQQRHHISEEFMTFLIAMAVSDQALHYAQESDNKKDGNAFIDNLFNTARQLFETHYAGGGKAEPVKLKSDEPSGQILQFAGDHADKSVE